MALGIPNRLPTQSFCAPVSTLRRGGIDFLAAREVCLTGRLRLAPLQSGNRQCLLTERGGDGSTPSSAAGAGVFGGVTPSVQQHAAWTDQGKKAP